MLTAKKMQTIMNEVVGGKVVKENDTGEAKKFRQDCVASIKRTRKIAKEKGIIPGLDLGRVNAKMEHCLLIAVTENVKREQMDQLLDFLKSVA